MTHLQRKTPIKREAEGGQGALLPAFTQVRIILAKGEWFGGNRRRMRERGANRYSGGQLLVN